MGCQVLIMDKSWQNLNAFVRQLAVTFEWNAFKTRVFWKKKSEYMEVTAASVTRGHAICGRWQFSERDYFDDEVVRIFNDMRELKSM